MIKPNFYLEALGAQVTRGEREYIKACAESVLYPSAPTFVNIGVMWGCSVHCLRAGHPTATIYALDIKYSWEIKYKDELNVTWLTGDSRTYVWTAPIDLLLIDGDHHYETVAADIANWVPHVPVGGLVLFHDYQPSALNMRQFPELEGVHRSVCEWQESEFDAGRNWEVFDLVDSIASFRRIT